MAARGGQKLPYIVMGPDIHGPTIYGRFGTLRNARRFSKDMTRHWTIVRVIHAGADLFSEREHKPRPMRLPNGDEAY